MTHLTFTKKQVQIVISTIFCLLLMLTSAIGFCAEPGNKDVKTVRVGWFNDTIFFREDGVNGRRSGYAYDYLQKLSNYTGWHYDYVKGDWSELLEALKKGEIDLLADVSYVEERRQYIDYTAYPMGSEQYWLYDVLKEEGNGLLTSLQDLQGKTISVRKGSYQETALKQWLLKEGLQCDVIGFDDYPDLYKQLKTRKVDVVANVAGYVDSMLNPSFNYGNSNIFFGVNKKRPDILAGLNLAMQRINLDSPNFSRDLELLYVHNDKSVGRLSPSAAKWIDQMDRPIRVGYMDEYAPYSFNDGNTHRSSGMADYVLQRVSEHYKLRFVYMPFTSATDMRNALKDGEVDIITPVYSDVWLAEQNGYMQTDPFVESVMVMFYNGDASVRPLDTIAVTPNSPFQEARVKLFYPTAKLLVCNSLSECLKKVKDGEATSTIIDSNIVDSSYYLSEQTKGFKRIVLTYPGKYGFAVRRDEINLLSVMNAVIASIDRNSMNSALVRFSNQDDRYSVTAFAKNNIYGVVLVVGLLFLGMMMVYYRQYMLKQLSERDGLTGLLNRRAGELRVNTRLQNGSKGVFMLIDVDNFKCVNDVLGHKVGDKVLLETAAILQSCCRFDDIIVRLGGDEFIIFFECEDAEKLANTKGLKLQQMLSRTIKADGREVDISGSIGVALAPENGKTFDELYNAADELMYYVKRNGKDGFKLGNVDRY